VLSSAGGGTRAAVYTAAVLRALHRDAQLQNIILASGVSGGGVGLAYFAAYRELLLDRTGSSPDGGLAAWDHFFLAMQAEYIQNVLADVQQLRISVGDSWSHLLAEGIHRCFYASEIALGVRCPNPGRMGRSVGDISSVGLILNAAVAGYLRCANDSNFACNPEVYQSGNDSETLWLDWVKSRRGAAGAWRAGNYYVFSNLDKSLFASQATNSHQYSITAFPDAHQVLLHRAAAIQANFPPIFPNAAVDEFYNSELPQASRTWLTDGGASENTGAVSLLTAVRNSIATGGGLHESPGVLLLVVDGGSPAMDYTGDRGLEVLGAAKEKYGEALRRELIADINRLARARGFTGDFIVEQYLPIPVVLRSRGGLGTNWILPETVHLRDPDIEDRADSSIVATVNAKCIVQALRTLTCNAPVLSECGEASAAVRSLLERTRPAKEDTFRVRWRKLRSTLRVTEESENCDQLKQERN